MHDPRLVPLFFFGTLLVGGLAVAFVIVMVIQKQRQVKNRLARQDLAHSYSQALLRSQLEVQETTLATISRELHDNVVQVLSSGVMQINTATGRMEDNATTALVTAGNERVRHAINSIRLLSHSLNTSLVEERDIGTLLTDELHRIETFSGISCTIDVDDEEQPGPEQKLILFRIAQETLQNIIKHAAASAIEVYLHSDANEYLLRISDNGKGFDVDDPNVKSSLGIRNMHERAALLKGRLNISSQPGKGTTLETRIPLNIKYG